MWSHPLDVLVVFLVSLVLIIGSSVVSSAETEISSSCKILLNTDERTTSCFSRSFPVSEGTVFVCDTTAAWLHHVGGTGSWYPATPPEGTGTHTYALYKGTNVPCPANGSCPGCDAELVEASSAEFICSIDIDPSTCDIVGEPAAAAAATTSNSSPALSILPGKMVLWIAVVFGYLSFLISA